ncbi:MAG: family 10 glycosylhydrolase [candidate division WS1 bacterium]|nr:family 10 glycosylhydrolase [candidate division WS1 bacterium]
MGGILRRATILALVGLGALCSGQTTRAEMPTVAVIRADVFSGAGPEAKINADARYAAVMQALKADGIPCRETADSIMTRYGLPEVPVAIMPWSPCVSDAQLGHIRAFLNRGGRMIVFLASRNDLSADLGARTGDIAREVLAGQFHSMARVSDAIPALPRQLDFGINRAGELWPAAGGRTVYTWHTRAGSDAGMAAVVMSDRGAVIAAPPSAGDNGQLRLLLRGLIGHFAPGLWSALAPQDPALVGPVGHYRSMLEFNSALRRAEGDYLSGARSDMREALGLLSSVPDLLATGRQEEAIAASRSAKQRAWRAWWRSYPSYSPEMRGVWASDTVDGGWNDAIAKLRAANFNVVFPYMASGATAYYPSRVLPRTANCCGDRLAEAIAAGRKHGVEVHPRILGLFTMGASAELKEQLRAQGRLAKSPSGVDSSWLCPSNHQNRLQIIQTAVEMVKDYGADGVQFDYVRYSWTDRCVCENCRKRFEADTGVRVNAWPADVLSGAHKSRFLQWRRNMLTSLVRTARQKVKEANPSATFSASVFINWESHRDSFGQDWKAWIDEGLLDFVSPMTYVGDTDKFQEWVRKQEGWAGDKVPVAMGIGPFADINPRPTPQVVLDQIQAARKLGCEGFVLFNYREALAEDYLPVIGLGATSTPAEIPTRARR